MELKKNPAKLVKAVFAAAVVLIPLYVTNTYALKIICNVMLYSIIALSVNLIVGFCGQLDFGRAAFAGLGAYFSAVTFNQLGLPFLVCFLGGAVFAALVGGLLGMLCRYTSFDYLTLITIGFSEICRKFFINWRPITNGAFGLATKRPSFFGVTLASHQSMFYFSLALLLICYVVIRRITRSKIGRAFKAIRDDSIAASYAGINVPNYKVLCFVIGSFFTGLAGAAMVHYTMFTAPTNYTLDESIIMLQMAILGGLGSLPGSIVGAAILIIMPEISRPFYNYRLLFMGILMVVLMLFAPKGIMGTGGLKDQLAAFVKRLWRKRVKQGKEGDSDAGV